MSPISTAKVAISQDKRAKQRRWRLEGGRISSTDGVFSLPCTIVDMTDEGARVRVAEPLNMPTSIRLLDTRERFAYTADLVWSGPPEYGLKLIRKTPF